jgi:thiol-disulfide isomerase/thioredoxin
VKPRILCPLVLAALVAIAACAKVEPVPVAAAPQKAKPQIAWFDGSLDAAFELARTQNKPVFLYWGAVWCPPCHKLSASVFSRHDFIEKSKLFVPVYLNGDEPGAQKAAEDFKVVGYPSVVVLSGDRTELARISGGMDLSMYGEVLDVVLRDVRPVSALLATLDSAADLLTQDECRRLAYNDWFADDAYTGNPSGTSKALETAAGRCPVTATVERGRLLAVATYMASRAERDALKAGKPPSKRLAGLVTRIGELLADRSTALGAADTLLSLGEDFFTAARQGEQRQGEELLQQWLLLMDTIAVDPDFAVDDQIYAIANKLQAVKSFGGETGIPPALAEAAQRRVDAALATTTDADARSAVVNSVQLLYAVLGDNDRAYALLQQEIKTSKAPYYYLVDLAALEEERGRKDEAVALLEHAYRDSKGTATRFQWATEYVFGLLRMRPQDEARIRAGVLASLAELEGADRIYGRTRIRLERLDTRLREWNKAGAHAAAIASFRQRMAGLCMQIQEKRPRGSCDAFLSKA